MKIKYINEIIMRTIYLINRYGMDIDLALSIASQEIKEAIRKG